MMRIEFAWIVGYVCVTYKTGLENQLSIGILYDFVWNNLGSLSDASSSLISVFTCEMHNRNQMNWKKSAVISEHSISP